LSAEHVALLDPVHLGGRLDQAHRALPDLLADRAAAGHHLRSLGKLVAPQLVPGASLRLYRLGPRLQDVQLAILPVATPLDVHRPLVVLLDGKGVAAELFGFHVGDRESPPIFFGDIDRSHRSARALAVAIDYPARPRAQAR